MWFQPQLLILSWQKAAMCRTEYKWMAMAGLQYNFIYQSSDILLTLALGDILKEFWGDLGISQSERVIPHALDGNLIAKSLFIPVAYV